MTINKKTMLELNLSNVKIYKEAGQKIVYTANSDDHGLVVLKIIKPGQDLARIIREIEILKTLDGIRTANILDDGKVVLNDVEHLYIIESFIEGDELRDYLNKSGNIPLNEVCNFLQMMVETIAILEEYRLVHRDIKPENIIRTASGEYILIDFGIARDLSRTSLTDSADARGPATVIYAPIEQIDNLKDQIDSRTDLYSVCLVAYEMLCGVNPFSEGCDNMMQVMRKIDQGNFARIEDNNDLIEFIHTNLNRHRTRRSANAKDAKDWIDEIASNLCGEET